VCFGKGRRAGCTGDEGGPTVPDGAELWGAG
jgi:hypothetical protein